MQEPTSTNATPTPRRSRHGSGNAHPPPKRQRRRVRSEIAEGVISTAIAVLIVAFLGIALWKGFDLMMNSATDRTQQQVEQIGN